MKKTVCCLAALLSLCACDGILEGIYDAPASEAENEYGFVSIDEQNKSGRIYVDATAYTEWHYISLNDLSVTAVAVGEAAPEQWDFAVHRYDAKTNGGSVWETPATDFGSLPSPDGGEYVSDEWTTNRITVDMSQMMEGIVVYAEDYRNPCLSRWLNVDTSTMPPIYTLSGKVYLLRTKAGKHVALRLTNFMNDAAVKGFLTIEYKIL